VTERSVVTIERHIMEAERQFPEATGAFSNLLYDMALAAKMISREVRRAGLVDILGHTGGQNVHGEHVKKLDEYAHDVIYRALDHCGHLCVMASEEAEELIPIPDRFPTGNYVLLYDPLDGSSNIDANVPVGTIFSIHRKVSDAERGTLEDCLQPGSKQVAAGYVLYGSSTMMVYTTGNGVHGFTLDPSIGEFVLSHPNMRIPKPGQRIYSVNEGNYRNWSPRQQALIDHLKGVGGEPIKPFTARYVGSMVADIHRTLLYGGIFMYPGDAKNPRGKLRLLYEAAPMAMLVVGAGGLATDGEVDVLSLEPKDLHERVPLYVGSAECVELAQRFLTGAQAESQAAVAV
jgi:fructose-1,6-bisphosphatase I